MIDALRPRMGGEEGSVALLPGEIADSDLPDDAEHWAAVYEELTGFLEQVDPLDGALERYRRRLMHWRCRLDVLGVTTEADRHPSEAR